MFNTLIKSPSLDDLKMYNVSSIVKLADSTDTDNTQFYNLYKEYVITQKDYNALKTEIEKIQSEHDQKDLALKTIKAATDALNVEIDKYQKIYDSISEVAEKENEDAEEDVTFDYQNLLLLFICLNYIYADIKTDNNKSSDYQDLLMLFTSLNYIYTDIQEE